MNNELIGIISNEGELKGVVEDDGLSVNVTIVGTGEQGEIGKSAYQEWLDLGNVGSEGDFLLSLKGQDGYTPQKGIDYFDGENGLSAYDVWKSQGNVGTVEDYLSSLKGSDAEVTIENIKKALGYTPADATNEHTHTNKSTIDKFTEVDNKPYYNGEVIATVEDIPSTTNLMPVSGGTLENYREKLTTLTGASTTINLSLGNVFTHSLTENTTYSITNAISGEAHSFTLIITQTATARTITFPASVKWQGGEIPDLSTASKTYILTFVTINGGTTWLGMFGGEF